MRFIRAKPYLEDLVDSSFHMSWIGKLKVFENLTATRVFSKIQESNSSLNFDLKWNEDEGWDTDDPIGYQNIFWRS